MPLATGQTQPRAHEKDLAQSSIDGRAVHALSAASSSSRPRTTTACRSAQSAPRSATCEQLKQLSDAERAVALLDGTRRTSLGLPGREREANDDAGASWSLGYLVSVIRRSMTPPCGRRRFAPSHRPGVGRRLHQAAGRRAEPRLSVTGRRGVLVRLGRGRRRGRGRWPDRVRRGAAWRGCSRRCWRRSLPTGTSSGRSRRW